MNDIVCNILIVCWMVATAVGIGSLLYGYIEIAILAFVLANGFNLILIRYDD